jgi:hypothetical protein
MVTTERLRELQTRYAIGGDLMQYAPHEVFRMGRDIAAALAELLEYREAEAESERLPEADHSFPLALP